MHTKFAKAILGQHSSGPGAEQLEMWSKLASKRFIQDGIDLNTSIKKLAEQNDLNPHFIERLCEMSNLATHNALIPKDPEKRASFAFPLANSKEVIASIEHRAAPVAILSDYASPPEGLGDDGPSMNELFGVSEPCHNGFDLPERTQTVIMIQKKAALRQQRHDQLIKAAMMIEDAEKKAYSAIKQAMCSGQSLPDIHKAACLSGLGHVTQKLLPKTAALLGKEISAPPAIQQRLEKLAFKAPEELIDRSVPMKVVNGRNTVIASLDTLNRCYHDADRLKGSVLDIDDEIKGLRKRLKEISA